MTEQRTNWAGNYRYGAARVHRPETVEQVREVVAASERVKVLGTRHAFNGIADTTGVHMSLARLNRVVALDPKRRTVTVEAGIRYGELCQWLDRAGYALHNLASLPHISVAGACATATHGSGDRLGNLATAVMALEMVTASGEVVRLSREQGGAFWGAVVGLGALGVVTTLTLDVEPAYEMRQDVYENLPLAQLDQHFDAITSSAYSVSLFTDWQHPRFTQVWLKSRTREATLMPPTWFGATQAPAPRHPIASLPAQPCTEQMGVHGPWHERLPHFRLAFTPSSGEELQSEYLVPRPHALAALHALARLGPQIAPLLQISEVRTIAADALWMSPCYQQPCVGIHFTWEKSWPAVRHLLPTIEAVLAPFDARPHWGKLFTMDGSRLSALYERLPDFRALMERYDPAGKFRNAFLDRHLFGMEGERA